MTSNIEEEKIRKRVFREIAYQSDYEENEIRMEQNLKIDLGLTVLNLGNLAAPFQRIARDYNSSAKIGRSQCEKLETVANALELVLKAAGFEAKKEEEK